MAEKTGFWKLLGKTWKQMRSNRRLPGNCFVALLLYLTAAFFLLFGCLLIPALLTARRGGVEHFQSQMYSPIGLVLNLVFALIVLPAVIGLLGEFHQVAPASVRRMFSFGFSRMRQVWYIVALAFVVQGVQQIVHGNPWLSFLLLIPMIVLAIFMGFLAPAAASGEKTQGFKELYANAWRATRRGWGRMILFYLFSAIAAVVYYIPFILLVAIATLLQNSSAGVAIAIILAICWGIAGIVFSVYLNCLMFGFLAHLYRDAAGLPPMPENGEEASVPYEAGMPAEEKTEN